MLRVRDIQLKGAQLPDFLTVFFVADIIFLIIVVLFIWSDTNMPVPKVLRRRKPPD